MYYPIRSDMWHINICLKLLGNIFTWTAEKLKSQISGNVFPFQAGFLYAYVFYLLTFWSFKNL